MARLTRQQAIKALDAIDGHDGEVAHSRADEVLLAHVHPDVRAAYERLSEDRASFWATA